MTDPAKEVTTDWYQVAKEFGFIPRSLDIDASGEDKIVKDMAYEIMWLRHTVDTLTTFADALIRLDSVHGAAEHKGNDCERLIEDGRQDDRHDE